MGLYKPRSSTLVLAASFLLYLVSAYDYDGVELSETPDFVIEFDPQELSLEKGSTSSFNVTSRGSLPFDMSLELKSDPGGIVSLSPTVLNFTENSLSFFIEVGGIKAGLPTIYIADNDTYYDSKNAFINIKVKIYEWLDTFDDVVGWIYFVAWIVSFYPQIWINFRRKSVVGMNLDFVSLNVMGFTCYSLYNCGLYFIPSMKDQYAEEYEHSILQVQLQDVLFGLFALLSTIVTALQAAFYERGGQRVSRICLGIFAIFFTFLIISLILACVDVISWLDYLYYFSYVKLAITIIKYCPQAYFNFRRKSTRGWSIGNILLDLTGGVMSMLQMFVIAFNYDDWNSLFGDPTKFGLSMFSILFDILFIVQHYILYGNRKGKGSSTPYENIDNDVSVDADIVRNMVDDSLVNDDSVRTTVIVDHKS